eukprot:8792881-Pyramimonas_sp.AAC.1
MPTVALALAEAVYVSCLSLGLRPNAAKTKLLVFLRGVGPRGVPGFSFGAAEVQSARWGFAFPIVQVHK